MTQRVYVPLTPAERAAERVELLAGLQALAVTASEHQLDQLQELLDRTEEANAQFNLTAIRHRPLATRHRPSVIRHRHPS